MDNKNNTKSILIEDLTEEQISDFEYAFKLSETVSNIENRIRLLENKIYFLEDELKRIENE